ncbi:MAG TPA: hypothetical protein VN132_03180, partial [Bdellovibrio sp.]|nr:hypothetical protein [Bdellovibrio sp.]
PKEFKATHGMKVTVGCRDSAGRAFNPGDKGYDDCVNEVRAKASQSGSKSIDSRDTNQNQMNFNIGN